jgi:methionine-S-sulfoxide reductase
MLLLLLACTSIAAPNAPGAPGADPEQPAPIPPAAKGQATAVFAGGCFWCMESDFDKLPGVVSTTSGYAGGHVKDPTYDQVGRHGTGHLETVRVVFDTSRLTYEQVLDYYWHHVDPLDAGGQFCDRGEPYETGVFPDDAEQEKAAVASKAAIDASHKLSGPIVTKIFPIGTPFYAAENYHQNFHETTPGRYNSYRFGCGREAKVALIWGL